MALVVKSVKSNPPGRRKPFGVVQCANCATDVVMYKRYDDRRGDPEVYCKDCNKKKPKKKAKQATRPIAPQLSAKIPQPGDICAICGATLVWDSFDQRGMATSTVRFRGSRI